MDHVPQVNQRRLAVLLALLALVSMLFSMGAHAAGKDMIVHKDVVYDNLAKELQLPQKIADRRTAYPVMKRLGKARVATLARTALGGPAGAVATLGGLILLDYTSDFPSKSPLAWDDARDKITSGEIYPGTWQCDTTTERNEGCTNITQSAAAAFNLNKLQTGANGSTFTYSMTECQVLSGTQVRCFFQGVRNSTGQVEPTAGGWQTYNKTSSNYPTGYQPPEATDDQIVEAWGTYDDLQALKQFYDEKITRDIIDQAPHEPIDISQESLDKINQAIRDGVFDGLTDFEEEMAKWAREHNVTVPDPNSVPEADTDGEDVTEGTEVTVHVTVDVENPEEDDLASGGEDCTAPPSCSGQQIQCMQVMQAWRARCVDPPTETDLLTAIGATDAEKGLEPGPNDGTFTVEDLDDSAFISGVACPTAPSFTVSVAGQSKTISMEELWEPACYMADKFAPFVLAMAYLSAALLLFRNFAGA